MYDSGWTPTEYSPDLIVALCVVMPMFSIVAVILRFLVRLRIQPTYLGIDDWMILAAVILLLGDCANLAMTGFLGIQGRDYPDQVPLDRQMLENKSDYAQLILEKPLYGLMKMSMCFFYRRIFSADRKFMNFNTFVIAFLATWTVSYMIAEIFVCGADPSISWDPTQDAQSLCVNRTILNFTYAVTDALGDAVVVLMPLPAIRKLHCTRQQRCAVAFIFLMAGLSTAAAFARLGFISKAVTKNYDAFNINTHGAATAPSLWSMIEGAVGVLAACLPPLGPLIRRLPSPPGLYSSWRSRGSSKERTSLAATRVPSHAVDQRRQWRPSDLHKSPPGLVSHFNPHASRNPSAGTATHASRNPSAGTATLYNESLRYKSSLDSAFSDKMVV